MPLAEVYAPMSRHHLRITYPKLLMPGIAQWLGTSPGVVPSRGCRAAHGARLTSTVCFIDLGKGSCLAEGAAQ
eukprot:4217866-Pyramimonas_sp.AAC.1